MNANETIRTIEERRSTRLFTEEEISENDILTILRSANQAPSAHNRQSWRFIVVRGSIKQELAGLVNVRATKFPKPSSTLLRMASRSISSAPVVVAVVNTGELVRHGTQLFGMDGPSADLFRTMEIQSSAAAAQNMLLAATSLGLASVWLGILFLIKDDVLRLFDVREGEFMAVVPIGHAVRQSAAPQKKALETMVQYMN
jgi:nitroreductase